MIHRITRTNFTSCERNATVRQSEINLGTDPIPDVLLVENLRPTQTLYYKVRESSYRLGSEFAGAVVYECASGGTITVLMEEK